MSDTVEELNWFVLDIKDYFDLSEYEDEELSFYRHLQEMKAKFPKEEFEDTIHFKPGKLKNETK